jgi:hypothetical protein
MRPIGFSTGALAYADFRRALELLRCTEIDVVELSALRETELVPLVNAIDGLDLSQFSYVSVHAPSMFREENESYIVDALMGVAERGWPIIVHPDAIHNHDHWRRIGGALCLENMDSRKLTGRSADELGQTFDRFPEATFCFDIGHARQCDSTMTEAYLLLTSYRDKLVQVHVSEVNTSSKHDVMSFGSILAYRKVAHLIPTDIPLILETPTAPKGLQAEIQRVREALPVCVAV